MDASDSPRVIAFPPLIFGGFALVGAASHLIHPIDLAPHFALRVAGAILAVVAPSTALAARSAMVRSGTNINPSLPALAVARSGPYRFTRNPMYLSLCLLNLGIGLLLCDAVPILLTLGLFWVLHVGVILREERYMEAKFGEAYTSYKAGVRRWL